LTSALEEREIYRLEKRKWLWVQGEEIQPMNNGCFKEEPTQMGVITRDILQITFSDLKKWLNLTSKGISEHSA